MTQSSTEPGAPEPGPDNFSFEEYLEGVSTFPVFEHTAYMDQRSGAELAVVMERLDGLTGELANTEVLIKRRTESSSNSFVDAVLDGLTEQREELEARIAELNEEFSTLREKVIKSGITLVFQVKTPEELGTVTREATRNFHKENKQFSNPSEEDLDYITARSRYTLTAQIAHFCTNVKLPDGREVPPPTRQGAEKLLRSLISSEVMRLMESVGTGLSASRDWANKLDAGFPGRSSDVEEVGVGEADPESIEVVGRSASDDADGGALGLV